MKTMKKSIALKSISLAAVMALSSLAFTGCGASETSESKQSSAAESSAQPSENESKSESSKSDEKIVVNVAGMTTLTFEWTSKLAYLKGFYEEEFADDNIEINYIDVGMGPAVNEAYLAGELDIAIYGDFPFFSGIANGSDITLISNATSTHKGVGLAVAADSEYTDVSQLRGQKVSAGIGTTNHQQLIRYLATAGLTADDVEIINSQSSTDSLTSLLSGEIAAFTVVDPTLTLKVNSGEIRIISTGEEANAQNSLYVTATDSFLAEHGDIAVRFLKVLNKAYEWYNESDENKQEAYELLADYSGTDAESIPLWIDNFDTAIHLNDDDISSLKDTYEFMLDNDLLQAEVNVDEFIDDTYVKEALGE